MEWAKFISLAEKLLKIPAYYPLFSKGDDLYAYRFAEKSEIVKLNLQTNEETVLFEKPSLVAVSKNWPPKTFLVARDIAKGKELHETYLFEDEKSKKLELEPMRIWGASIRDNEIIVQGSTEKSNSLYYCKSEKCEKLIDVPLAFFFDFSERQIALSVPSKGFKAFDIMIYDRKTGEIKSYTPKEGSSNVVWRFIDDQTLLFESNFQYVNKSRLYYLDLNNMKVDEVKFTHDEYYKFDPVEHQGVRFWNGKLTVSAKKNGLIRLFIDGEEVKFPDGTIVSPIMSPEGKIYATLESFNTPPTLYEYYNGQLKVIRKPVIEKLPLEVSFIKYKSKDGTEIPSYLIINKEVKQPGPSIVYIHGGPWSENYNTWDLLIILTALAGFHVIAPNFRGSTGYGFDYMLADIGDPGGKDAEDVLSAKDYLKERGIADSIAVFGYSYGGYMTSYVMTRYAGEFCCGVAGAPVVDWEEMYELGDASFKFFVEMLTANNKELLKDRSPVTYVDKTKNPLAIIISQNDTRTPLKPVMKFVQKLMEGGKTFEFHVLPDAGHTVSTADDVIKILLPAIVFLRKYMYGE